MSKMVYWSGLAVVVLAFWCRWLSFPWTISVSLALFLALYDSKLAVIFKTFSRDLRFFLLLRKTYAFLTKCHRENWTILDLFAKRVEKNPEKAIFYFEDQIWTYSDVEEFSNKIANVFKKEGYKKGDVVAVLMGNCVEYIGIWFGLAKIGVVAALLNFNLRNKSLSHCLKVAQSKALVYSGEFDSAVDEIPEKNEITRFRWGAQPSEDSVRDLKWLMNEASGARPVCETNVGYRDKALLIYTSGTTGLPKAAIIPHHRLLMMSTAVSIILGVKENDIVYNPLPLYHTAGGLLGVVGPLAHGCSCVIKKKFSASSFWPDCIKYHCTAAQYIGEMCRYVMMVPPRPEDTQHKVKFIFGNGMKVAMWIPFKERFRLDKICEIYGSTEGNTNLVNLDKTVGAVGFLPRIIPESLIPMALIKVNEFGEPIRDSKGFCVRCAPGEPGMFVGMITKSDAIREYNGYVGNKEESEKKVIKNVFKRGDKAFLSGDILVMDDLGYLYFKDRTGDTYRWKGENVSTTEVEGVISSCVGLRDVLVYGVQVGNLEGRAGMATIVDPESKIDLENLTEQIRKNLPVYARPLFLRFTDRADITGTFKLRKLNFQKEGFDPRHIKDKMFFYAGNDGYVELTPQIYEDIVNGRLRT